MTYPATDSQRAALYLKAVHEIRTRLRCVDELLGSGMAPLLIHEFCHLQLRLSAECFAIACLAAQGDFETHKAFRDRYEPGAIFKALESLYPAFFPTPSILQQVEAGRWHFDDQGHGHPVTRTEIEGCWNLSGAHLHRGSTKRYLQEEQAIDFVSILRVKEKLWNLLMDHMIVLSDQVSRLHVHVDRHTEDIRCHFLFLDVENGTARIEAYDAVAKVEDHQTPR